MCRQLWSRVIRSGSARCPIRSLRDDQHEGAKGCIMPVILSWQVGSPPPLLPCYYVDEKSTDVRNTPSTFVITQADAESPLSGSLVSIAAGIRRRSYRASMVSRQVYKTNMEMRELNNPSNSIYFKPHKSSPPSITSKLTHNV